ncbi:hypothetical protein GJAV_G00067210 [Gymnothorax javanicus]|nr:hypothetical protein GJAV_G00067210 [Gymnothorax javanicus]
MWEDERNKRGGRWLITLNKQQRKADLDRFWLETATKIAVWTTDYGNREAVTHIGRVYKERLGVPQKLTIGYQSHADTATKSGSTTKNKFIV